MNNLLFNRLNLAKHLSNHLVGPNQTGVYWCGFGLIILATGVIIGHAANEPFILSFTLTLVGDGVYAIGFIPFVEAIIKTHMNPTATVGIMPQAMQHQMNKNMRIANGKHKHHEKNRKAGRRAH